MKHINWTPEQRAELVATVKEQAQQQIEADPEMRAMVDWMVEASGMQPSAEAYRLVFLVSTVMFSSIGAQR